MRSEMHSPRLTLITSKLSFWSSSSIFAKKSPNCGPSCRSAGPTVPKRAQWAPTVHVESTWFHRERDAFEKKLERSERHATKKKISRSNDPFPTANCMKHFFTSVVANLIKKCVQLRNHNKRAHRRFQRILCVLRFL